MRILGHTYRVDRSRTVKEIGASGRCLGASQVLQVASDLTGGLPISVLLHEAAEAIDYHLGLQIAHSSISGLVTGLYQVLVDNGVDLRPLLEDAEGG